jgi:prolyl oligopeptidase
MRTQSLALLFFLGCAHAPSPSASVHDATKRLDIVEELHGVKVEDPYRWLEDASKADVKSWMDVQNKSARDYLSKLSQRDALQKRLTELYYVDEIGTPYKRGDHYFIWKRPANAEKGIMYFKDSLDAEEKVLLDPNELSKERGPVSLGTITPTWDGKTVAYALRPNNADEATLYVMDVKTRKTSKIDVIEGVKYADPSWTADGSGFYYTWLPTDPKISIADRPGYAEVRFHRLGTNPTEDILVHERLNDPKTFIDAQLSKSGRWLFLTIWHGWSSNEVFVKDMAGNGAPAADFDSKKGWRSISQGRKARFKIKAHEDKFYIATNDEASHWKVMLADPQSLDRAEWKTILPEDSEAVLKSFTIVGGHLGTTFMKNATSEIRIYSLLGSFVRTIDLPVLGSASSLVGNPEDDEAFFGFSSFVSPYETYRTSIKSGETKVFTKSNVKVDSSAFEVKQVWYPSKDGTKVSMFIVHKKGLTLTGDNPTLLYGYGGFNISLTPRFRASTYAWLEKGGVYAMPNLRGGGEYGESWHQAGMLTNKQNVFDDYIAAAEFLIQEKYTKTRRLAISGRSNGGLLVGAAMTQRPDLYQAVICGVPLLDMVRYHLFGSGKTWIPEYGSADDEEQFKAILAYSPYHQTKPGVAYPSLLMLATDADDRVDPLHARTFVAAIAHASSSDAAVLLRIEKNAGHGGADARAASVREGVDVLAYLIDSLGLQ